MNTTAHQDTDGKGNGTDSLSKAYEQLCKSHDAIDSFRTTLLHLLPVASAGGLFLLLNKDIFGILQPNAGPATTVASRLPDLMGALGLFGFLVTFGFFVFEIYGIRKCHAIILAAKDLERQLGMPGPFTARPRAVLGLINEPFAAGIIYPAVMAAWTFMGLHFTAPSTAWWAAAIVFLTGFASTVLYNLYLKHDAENWQPLKELAKRILKAEESGDAAVLERLLASEFKIRRSDGNTHDRKQYLEDVPVRKNRGRSASQVDIVRLGWRNAVLTCRVMTTRDAQGNPAVGQFWNTQWFVQRGGRWQCIDWQVVKMDDE